jgi:hypothetical protein
METLKKYMVEITGITPLVMHSDKLCNPLHPMTKQMKEITSVRKKTDEHHLAMARIEWEASLYYDETLGLYMPSKNLRGCIRGAAKKYKLGKCTKAMNLVDPLGYPIIGYEGCSIENLWEGKSKSGAAKHIFCESVTVNRAKIMRTRAIFTKWAVKFDMYLQIEILSERQIKQILDTAGFEYGLGDLRPENATGNFGKFTVDSVKEIS